jgi:hypothetical protein
VPGLDVERVVGGAAAASAPGGMMQTVHHWESLVGALRSVQILRLHRGFSSILLALAANPFLLPDLQKLYVAQCDVGCAVMQPQDGVVLGI